jgi:hypothetical protein
MAASNYITDKVQQALKSFLQTQDFTAVNIPSDQIYAGIENETVPTEPELAPVTRKLPCIQAVCQSAEAVDEHFLNWLASARVEIRTNADDTTETDHHAAAAAVLNTITTDTIAADLSGALADFKAFLVNFKSQRWELVDRSWQSLIEFEVHCAGSDIS